jgi:hypothetical protein
MSVETSEPGIEILVDADACPVREEILKVAARHGLRTTFVANKWLRLDEGPLVRRVLVADGPDVADDWIASHAGPRTIVVTQDIPLAARCIKAGARVIDNSGRVRTEANIGDILATRNLMAHLREIGAASTYNAAQSKADRSRVLQSLEQTVQDLKRGR